MDLVNNLNELKKKKELEPLFLLYVQAPDCGLCSIMLDKIEAVTHQYANLRSARVELHVLPEIAGTFLVATAPTVLLFAHGKEVFRAGTFIDLIELKKTLTKWNENITSSFQSC